MKEINTLLSKQKSRRYFTLIEVMVAIGLILIVSGVISLKMYGAVEKKKFQSDIDQLKSRIEVAKKMAVSMQADWSLRFTKKDKHWLVFVQCDELVGKKLKPLDLDQMSISFEGKRITDGLTIDFFSSGHTAPAGLLLFEQKSHRTEVKIN